jgi:hypothetical protein
MPCGKEKKKLKAKPGRYKCAQCGQVHKDKKNLCRPDKIEKS